MELDIIAYNPSTNHLIHLEPSIDADSWTTREFRFRKKFEAGKKYILKDVFKWLGEIKIDQTAVLITHPKNKDKIGGGTILSVDELLKTIKSEIKKIGIAGRKAIPEQYPMLRTIQFAINGWHKCL